MKSRDRSSPLRMAYVVSLDLPGNRRAHAVQVMKNAQAWAKITRDFELVTNVSWGNHRRIDPERLAVDYGIMRPFSLHALPLLGLESSSIRWLNSLFYRLAARRLARRRTELVYTRNTRFPGFSLKRRIPTLVEVHGPPGTATDQEALRPCLQDPLLLGLVTISEELAHRYQEWGTPPEKIIVAPDGVDLERFHFPLTREEARQRLGLPLDRPLAVYVGHLYPGRGIEEILAAARELGEVDFLLVGGMPNDLARWRQEVADTALANVRFAGHVANDRVPTYLWAADVLLMPYGRHCPTSQWMSPMKMFEYMAASRPMVATDLAALRTVLRHEENAWLVAADDGKALAGGILTVLTSPELAGRLAATARREVEAFSWDRRVGSILERIGLASHAPDPEERPAKP
ncbi:MAG: glycosyltransferase family 4 protein [Magnetococcales bacterium]|nr:glycosyltransferase family 4 protein [Magnetococcales bacterium]